MCCAVVVPSRFVFCFVCFSLVWFVYFSPYNNNFFFFVVVFCCCDVITPWWLYVIKIKYTNYEYF
jgi:hypothetical protein